MVKIEAFLDLEKALATRLTRAWYRDTSKTLVLMGKAVREDDFAQALDLVNNLSMVPAVRRNLPYIRVIGTAAVVFGASRLGKPTVDVLASADIKSWVDKSAEQFLLLAEDLSFHVMEEARKLITKEAMAHTSGVAYLVKAEVSFVRDMVSSIRNEGKSSLLLGASLHNSRLSAWGFTVEARHRKITKYKISEQMDGRTCPICRHMNGKVFDVKEAVATVERALSVQNPQELKVLSPWPKQTSEALARFRTMSNKELVKKGWNSPPFHPMCRGILVKEQEVIQEPPFSNAHDWYDRKDATGITPGEILNLLGPATRDKVALVDTKIRGLAGETTTDLFLLNGAFTTARTKVHSKVLDSYLSDEQVSDAHSDNPEIVLIGGRSGSGKSAFLNPVASGGLGLIDKKKYISVDPEKIKQALPGFVGWNAVLYHKEAGYLAAVILEEARRRGLNVSVSVTMRTKKTLLKILKNFKGSGYKTSTYYMFAPRQVAASRAVSRDLGRTGGYVPLDVVLNNTTNEKVFDTLREEVDTWKFYDHSDKLPKFIAEGPKS